MMTSIYNSLNTKPMYFFLIWKQKQIFFQDIMHFVFYSKAKLFKII